MDFNEKNATEAVLNSFAGIKDNRLKEIMSSIKGKNLYFYLTSWVFQCY